MRTKRRSTAWGLLALALVAFNAGSLAALMHATPHDALNSGWLFWLLGLSWLAFVVIATGHGVLLRTAGERTSTFRIQRARRVAGVLTLALVLPVYAGLDAISTEHQESERRLIEERWSAQHAESPRSRESAAMEVAHLTRLTAEGRRVQLGFHGLYALLLAIGAALVLTAKSRVSRSSSQSSVTALRTSRRRLLAGLLSSVITAVVGLLLALSQRTTPGVPMFLIGVLGMHATLIPLAALPAAYVRKPV